MEEHGPEEEVEEASHTNSDDGNGALAQLDEVVLVKLELCTEDRRERCET